jgi:hypothetical protein
MIFERPGEPDVSIFLIALAPDPADHESDKIEDRSKTQPIAVGMKERELRAQFGAPKLQVPYTFKGHSAEHAIYETRPGKSFGRFTLIDGIVVDFADGGRREREVAEKSPRSRPRREKMLRQASQQVLSNRSLGGDLLPTVI